MQRESSTTPQHEATPWRFYLTDEGFDIYQDRDGYGDTICSIPGEPVAEANRAFAERAVNSHAALVEALAGLRAEVAGAFGLEERAIRDAIGNTNFGCIERRLEQAAAALAAAKVTK